MGAFRCTVNCFMSWFEWDSCTCFHSVTYALNVLSFSLVFIPLNNFGILFKIFGCVFYWFCDLIHSVHIMFVSFSHYILLCVLCFQRTTVHVHVHKLLMISNKGCTCQCFMHLLVKVVLWFIYRTRHFSVLFAQEFHAFNSKTVLNICTVAKVGDNADLFCMNL